MMHGLVFSALKDDMTIEVMTCNSHYLIRKENAEFTWIMGGTRKDGSSRYALWSPTRILGSSWDGRFRRAGYIGKSMNLDFFDIERDRIITTSPIRSVCLLYSNCTFQI